VSSSLYVIPLTAIPVHVPCTRQVEIEKKIRKIVNFQNIAPLPLPRLERSEIGDSMARNPEVSDHPPFKVKSAHTPVSEHIDANSDNGGARSPITAHQKMSSYVEESSKIRLISLK
jgi:hypothetical protein